jgi:hypothetical protein
MFMTEPDALNSSSMMATLAVASPYSFRAQRPSRLPDQCAIGRSGDVRVQIDAEDPTFDPLCDHPGESGLGRTGQRKEEQVLTGQQGDQGELDFLLHGHELAGDLIDEAPCPGHEFGGFHEFRRVGRGVEKASRSGQQQLGGMSCSRQRRKGLSIMSQSIRFHLLSMSDHGVWRAPSAAARAVAVLKTRLG